MKKSHAIETRFHLNILVFFLHIFFLFIVWILYWMWPQIPVSFSRTNHSRTCLHIMNILHFLQLISKCIFIGWLSKSFRTKPWTKFHICNPNNSKCTAYENQCTFHCYKFIFFTRMMTNIVMPFFQYIQHWSNQVDFKIVTIFFDKSFWAWSFFSMVNNMSINYQQLSLSQMINISL